MKHARKCEGCGYYLPADFPICDKCETPQPAQADATKRWTLHKSFPSERYVECERKGWCEYQIHVEVVPLAALEQQAREFCETLDMIRRRAEQAEARLKEAVEWIKAERRDCGCTDRILANIARLDREEEV